MQGYGFNGLNNDNPLAQFLKQYAQPQQQPPQENAQPITEPQRPSSAVPCEVNSQSELEYIVPDKTGRKQIVDCPSENKIYVGRYSHSRQRMDWRAYVDEGEIKLSQNNDAGAGMSQIAEALVAVGGKLEAVDNKLLTMYSEIQGLKNIEPKNIEPKKEESARKPNGQFKKKGET